MLRILSGACPEHYEILHFALNDTSMLSLRGTTMSKQPSPSCRCEERDSSLVLRNRLRAISVGQMIATHLSGARNYKKVLLRPEEAPLGKFA